MAFRRGVNAIGLVEIGMTADAFEDTLQACLEAGMADFLTKPLDPNALRGILSRAQARQLGGGWTQGHKDAKLAS